MRRFCGKVLISVITIFLLLIPVKYQAFAFDWKMWEFWSGVKSK